MTEPLHELLDQYLEAYEAAGGVAELNPPVTEAEIVQAEEILGFEIPEFALALWRWRNGQVSRAAPFWLLPNDFVGLLRACRNYREYTAEDVVHAMEPVPGLVFADGGQVSIAVVSLRGRDVGAVWGWSYFGRGDGGIERVFDSIEDFVECHLRLLRSGVVERHAEYVPGKVCLTVPLGDERVEALGVPEAWQRMAGY